MVDVPLLIEHFLLLYSEKLKRPPIKLSHEAKEWLYSYEYPGNVRELSNIVEYAVALAIGEEIQLEDLPINRIKGNHGGPFAKHSEENDHLVIKAGLSLAEAERQIILHTLKQNDDHRKHTAEMLGISERTLRDKLKLYRVAPALPKGKV